ncbi:MAG: ATP-binding protein [Polyangiaceae bacterium]|nr:ATP-binding protein [Polyangiaceae bacterium]
MRPLTLIFGANNSGKSTVLEAAALALRAPDPGQWVQVARHRDMDMPLSDGLWSLFPGGAAMRLEDGPQQSEALVIDAKLTGTGHRRVEARCLASESWDGDPTSEAVLRLELRIDGKAAQTMEFRRGARISQWPVGKAYKVFTVTPATHRSTKALVEHLSRVVDEGKKHVAVEVLQLFDTDVEDIDVIASLGREAVRVTHRQRGVVDLASFGDGMRRATALSLALVRASRGLLLIDEIEAGIHHALHEKVFDKLFAAAHDLNVQILATTHSLEAIDATLTCIEKAGREDGFCAYWLTRSNATPEARRYDHEKLSALRDGGLDIR